jgi:hypothetical protein
MMQTNENPGVQAGAFGELLADGWSPATLTATERRAQILSRRFALSPSTAQLVAWLYFGEGRDD